MNDTDITYIFKNRFNANKLTEEIKQYLDTRFNDSLSYKESVWRILNKIEQRPICPICGGPVQFIGRSKKIYRETCSRPCANALKIQKLQQQYGENITNVFQLDPIKEKIKISNNNKYGTDYPLQNKDIQDKCKQSLLEKYGVDNVFKNKEIQYKIHNKLNYADISNKVKTTRLRKNNYKCTKKSKQKISESLKGKYSYRNNNIEKIKHTCLEKYGIFPASKDGSIKSKTKDTCMEKYGVDNYAKTPEYKDFISTYNSSYSVQNKSIETKKKNKSLNSSKQEIYAFNLLTSIFKEVKTQYRSPFYPFNCDFYIPEKDLYIECNFHWTHGPYPFDKDNLDDIKLLEKWKSKNSKFYDNAIETWTIRDPYKKQIALQNKLNYLTFYSVKDLEKYIKLF